MGISWRRPGANCPHPPCGTPPPPASRFHHAPSGLAPSGATHGYRIAAPNPTPHPGGDDSTVVTPSPPLPPAAAVHGAVGAGTAAIVCAHRNTSFTDGQVLRYIMDNSQRETLLIIQTHTEGRKCTLDFHVATRSCEAGSGCLFPHVTATQWVADSPESLAWGQEKAENTMSVHILSLKITLQHRLRRIKIRSGAVSRREEDEEGKGRQGNGRGWAASVPGGEGKGACFAGLEFKI